MHVYTMFDTIISSIHNYTKFITENDNTICVLSIDAAKNLNLNEEYNGLHLR